MDPLQPSSQNQNIPTTTPEPTPTTPVQSSKKTPVLILSLFVLILIIILGSFYAERVFNFFPSLKIEKKDSSSENVNTALGENEKDGVVKWIPLSSFDRKLFDFLGYSFSKITKQVVYGTEDNVGTESFVVDGADPASFLVYTKRITPNDISSALVSIHLAKDKSYVYFDGQKVGGADPATIEVLNHESGYFFKDKNHVYFKNNLITNADPATFVVLACAEGDMGECYDYVTKDKNNVYVKGKISSIADANSMVFSDGLMDKNNFYKVGTDGNLMPIPNINPSTYKKLGVYGKDAKGVYLGFQLLLDVDYNSFELIKGSYAKDKNHVYYLGQKIEGADLATFEVGSIVKDKNHVYSGMNIVQGADPATFVYIGNSGFGKDKNHVFYGLDVDNRFNPKTFSVVGNFYAKDDRIVYVLSPKMYADSAGQIMGADPMTFTPVLFNGKFPEEYPGYSKDANNVYFFTSKITGADPATFEILPKSKGSWWNARDKNHVYDRNSVVKDADPATFEILGGDYARDKDHVFGYNMMVLIPEADRDTFEVLGDRFARDKNHVYKNIEIIPDVVPSDIPKDFLD